MNRKDRFERLNEIRRLYEDEKLSQREIAVRFGVTCLAIHDSLVRAKIFLRPKRFVEHLLESETSIQLYKNECLTITEIASRLEISATIVSKELGKPGIKKRSKGFYRRKQPELYLFGIEDYLLLQKSLDYDCGFCPEKQITSNSGYVQ